MAVGILGGLGLLAKQDVSDYLMVGELSLDVKLRLVKGGEPCIAEVRSGRGGRSVDRPNAPGAAITFAKVVIQYERKKQNAGPRLGASSRPSELNTRSDIPIEPRERRQNHSSG